MTRRILRVFPRRHKQYTPQDDMILIGHPMLKEVDGQLEQSGVRYLPPHDEIHISCVFTWDKSLCEKMQKLYQRDTDKPVRIGGPAFGSPAEGFTQGLYLKRNIIFTSRGCNNACPWCGVPKLEGPLRELPVCQGNVIQDNNFLQTSRAHKDKVFDMLRSQSGICFKGGLERDLIDDHFVGAVTSLRIKELWLACDTDGAIPSFMRAAEKLRSAGFNREHIRCYALIGGDIDKNEARLREIYEAGAMPFAMLYRDFSDVKTQYSRDVEAYARMWQRPAATIAHMEKGTDWREYNT